MKGKPGRGTLMDEYNLAKRYADLSERYFNVLKKHMDSGDEKKEQWAVEQLNKAFVKMIPQTIGGDPNNPIVIQGVDIILRK